MFLIDLLKADAARFSDRASKVVASEEFIHLMLDTYRDELSELTFIKISDVPDFLKNIHKNKRSGHYQLFVEFSDRHALKPKQQDAIHYAAMDVFYDLEGDSKDQMIVFMADQYKGRNYHNYPASYDTLFDFPIHFIVAGGSPHQMDGKSCPIFTLRHLLLTANDTELHTHLKQLAQQGFLRELTSGSKMTPLPWFDLGVDYNANTQSFQQITRYVEHVKQKGRLRDAVHCSFFESSALREAQFDVRMSDTLKTIQLGPRENSLNPDGDFALRNEGIKDFEEMYAACALEYATSLKGGEGELIDICYGDSYPLICNILQTELQHRGAIHPDVDLHPHLKKNQLVSFIFSNQGFLNLLTRDKIDSRTKKKNDPHQALYLTFMNVEFLCLIQRGYLDPVKLLARITEKTNEYVLLGTKGHDVCVLHRNLNVCCHVLALLSEGATFGLGDTSETLPEVLLELLLIKHAADFFEVPAIRALYGSGEITNDMIQRSTLYTLRQSPELNGTPQQVKKLIEDRLLPSPVSVVASAAYHEIEEKEEDDSAYAYSMSMFG